MQKPVLLFLFLLFLLTRLNAQKIYYSPAERSAYYNTRSYIIGKIKNNILVWQYTYGRKNFELVIYDYNMQLQKRVPINLFPYNVHYSFNFINRQNYFDVIVQYNYNHTFYCKAASFDENGKLVRPVKTIESLKLKGKLRDLDEVYSSVQSENKQYNMLVNAISETDGMMEVNFLIFDKNLNCIKKGNTLLPFNSTHTILSPACVDNNGNLLLAEASNSPVLPSNIITIYKIERDNDTVANIVHDVGRKIVLDLSMKIDNRNNEYFVSAVTEDKGEKIRDSSGNGILSILLNSDFTEKARDHFSIFPIEKENTTRNENFFINNIIRNDSGYVIVCFAGKESQTSAEAYFSDGDRPAYNFVIQSLRWKPDNARENGLYDRELTPSPSIYNNQVTGPQRDNDIMVEDATESKNEEPDKIINEVDDSKRMILLYVSNKNEHTHSLIGTKDFDNASLFDLAFSQALNTKNGLHIIFPEVFREKGMLAQFIITSTNEIIEKQIISNDLRWDFDYSRGVQIDDQSIVFPGKLRGYLCFARIQFE